MITHRHILWHPFLHRRRATVPTAARLAFSGWLELRSADAPLQQRTTPALLEQLLQFVLQIEAAEVFGDDLALGVYQYVVGDAFEFVEGDGFAVPELQVADVCPGQAVVFDGFQPGCLFLVERY